MVVPGVALVPIGGIPGGAAGQDGGHAGPRLDVVHHGGLALDAGRDRIRGPQPRLAGVAFDRLDQGRLLAAHVGPRPATHRDAERPAAAENVVAQQSALFRLGNGMLERGDGQRVFAADVEESFPRRRWRRSRSACLREWRADRLPAPCGPCRSRGAFVGVADDVFQIALGLPGELPLSARWGKPPRRGRGARTGSSPRSPRPASFAVIARIAPR